MQDQLLQMDNFLFFVRLNFVKKDKTSEICKNLSDLSILWKQILAKNILIFEKTEKT